MTEVLGGKPVPVQFCPRQVLQELSYELTQAFVIGSQELKE